MFCKTYPMTKQFFFRHKKNLVLILTAVLWGCSEKISVTLSPQKPTSKPYVIKGEWHYPQQHYELVEEGTASHYGGLDGTHGSPTALGGVFNMHAMTAAHRTLPLPCVIFVENLENGRTAILTVNDRGPFKDNRILDVSVKAAHVLGFYHKGLTRVRITTLVKESLKLAENQPKYCLEKKSKILSPTHVGSQTKNPGVLKNAQKFTKCSLKENQYKTPGMCLMVTTSTFLEAQKIEKIFKKIGPTSLQQRASPACPQDTFRVLLGPFRHMKKAMKAKALLERKNVRNIRILRTYSLVS